MFKGRGDSKTCGHAFELSPSGPHGLGARRFIVAIPATKSGNDPGRPGQRMRRMGVFLAFGLALQRRANGFGRRQRGGIDHVGCRSRTAVARIDQLHRSTRRRQADHGQLE